MRFNLPSIVLCSEKRHHHAHLTHSWNPPPHEATTFASRWGTPRRDIRIELETRELDMADTMNKNANTSADVSDDNSALARPCTDIERDSAAEKSLDAPEKPKDPNVLLLSIIASTTDVWTRHDDVGVEWSLFPSAPLANAQTPMWIKATIHVLNGGQNGPALALETIQGNNHLIFHIVQYGRRFPPISIPDIHWGIVQP
jgi:hypothetical protein